MEQQKKSRFLKVAVIIGIVIILNLFFYYALSLVYQEPDFATYCPESQVITPVTSEAECISKGGQWNGNVTTAPVIPADHCYLNYSCQKQYDAVSNIYDRNIFIILVILGAICLVGGILIGSNPVISSGLAYGGILSFIIASTRYWSSAANLVKAIILFIALALLIGVAVRKFNEKI